MLIRRFTYLLLCSLSCLSLWSQKYLTLAEIHDYSPGDEFHIAHFHCCNELTFQLEQIIIKEKYLIDGSVAYSYYRNSFNFLNGEHPIIIDTLIYQQVDTLLLKNPDSVLFTEDDEAYKDPDLYHGRWINTDFFWFTNIRGKSVYVEGLGKVSLSWKMPEDSAFQIADSLVYYRKGNESWGKTILDIPTQWDYQDFTIAPNPTNKLIRITFSTSIHHSYSIFLCNSNGILIKQKSLPLKSTSSFTELDVHALPNGIYFLYLRTEKHMVTHKFVKI